MFRLRRSEQRESSRTGKKPDTATSWKVCSVDRGKLAVPVRQEESSLGKGGGRQTKPGGIEPW